MKFLKAFWTELVKELKERKEAFIVVLTTLAWVGLGTLFGIASIFVLAVGIAILVLGLTIWPLIMIGRAVWKNAKREAEKSDD